MLIQNSYMKTSRNDKFSITTYKDEKFIARIFVPCQEIVMDAFDVKNTMEALFSGLNDEQQKNMIKILRKEDQAD